MQKATLKVTMENGKEISDMGLILHCALEKLGCETTSLDPFAYIWDYPDNCVLSILRTEEVNIVKQSIFTTSLVEKTLRPNFCLKSRIIRKNIAGNPHLFTQQTRIRFIWLNSVKISICKPEEILAARRMVQLRSYSNWDPERKTNLVLFMRTALSWK